MRYLYTADDELFAYAPGRRDFFRSGDDQLWAHESHDWLIAAQSGVALAHRTGDFYYAAGDGERLYRVSSEAVSALASGEASADDDAGRTRRAGKRPARALP